LAEIRFLDNTAWQWLGLLGVILVALIAGRVAAFLLNRQADRFAQGKRLAALGLMLRSLAGPAKLLLLAGGLHLAGQFLTLRKVSEGGAAFDLKGFWEQVVAALAVLAAGWFLYRLVDLVEHFLGRWAARTETHLDEQLVPLVRKSLRAVVVIAIGLFVAQNVFHWNVAALLAGLGIGGLAVALAAQSVLADFFGSVRIFADRPFRPGETIRVKDHSGAVEEVGFRATRIRTADGDVVTIPNSLVASGALENLSRRPFLRRELNLSVAYGTPPEKMRRAAEVLRGMLEARKASFPPLLLPRVFFSDFGQVALRISVYYWFAPPDWWAFQQFNHDFNMELLQQFSEEGIEFALPTGTAPARREAAS